MKIHLIRHGRTWANEENLYYGASDINLSEGGIIQLQELKDTLDYPTANLYFTSGLKRANETLKLLYGGVMYSFLPAFREMNFGEFELKSYKELSNQENYLQWINNYETLPTPGGESKVDFENRVKKGIDALISELMINEEVVLIAHSGVIGCVMEHLFCEGRNIYDWAVGNGRGYTIEIDENDKRYNKI